MGVLERLKMNVCVQLGMFDLGLYLKLLSKLKLDRDRHIGRKRGTGLLISITFFNSEGKEDEVNIKYNGPRNWVQDFHYTL